MKKSNNLKEDDEKNKESDNESNKESDEESQKKNKMTKNQKSNEKLKRLTTVEEDHEIIKFMKNHHIFPSFLKYIKKGEIEINELDSEGLKQVKLDQIQIEKKVNYYEINKETMDNIEIDSSQKLSAKISYLKSNFESSKTDKNETAEIFIKGIYQCYSFEINEEYLSLDKNYLKKITEIADEDKSDFEKAKLLDEHFNVYGYLIPKKIYIGGSFTKKISKIQLENQKNKIIDSGLSFKGLEIIPEISDKNLNKTTHKEKILLIIGGDIDSEDIQSWKSSIGLKNAEVVKCEKIISVTNLFDKKLKYKLERPLNIINEEIKLFECYNDTLDLVLDKKNNLPTKLTIGNYSTFESYNESILDSPLIDCKCYFFDDKVEIFGFAKRRIKKKFTHKIVGLKIIDTKASWRSNGEWLIKKNCLGSNEIDIDFEAKLWSSQNYFVIIYLLKKPELGMVPEKRDNFELKFNGIIIGNIKDKDIDKKIERYFKNNSDSHIVEKILKGESCIEIEMDKSKELNPNVKIEITKKEKDDVLETVKKNLKPINSIRYKKI